MERRIPLCALPPMQRAVIFRIDVSGPLRRRLDDLGIIEGMEALCLRVCPLGDPALYLLRGTVLALRKRDAAHIEVLTPTEYGEVCV